MTSITSAADAGRQVKEARKRRGLTQEQLSAEAGVSRKFVARFEAGHDRAELGKTLQLLQAAGYSLHARQESERPPSPLQGMLNDAAATVRRELSKGDPEFALRIIGNTVTAISRCADPGHLLKPPALQDPKWDKLVAVAVRYALRKAGATLPTWTDVAPLPTPWFPYDSRTATPEYLPHQAADTTGTGPGSDLPAGEVTDQRVTTWEEIDLTTRQSNPRGARRSAPGHGPIWRLRPAADNADTFSYRRQVSSWRRNRRHPEHLSCLRCPNPQIYTSGPAQGERPNPT